MRSAARDAGSKKKLFARSTPKNLKAETRKLPRGHFNKTQSKPQAAKGGESSKGAAEQSLKVNTQKQNHSLTTPMDIQPTKPTRKNQRKSFRRKNHERVAQVIAITNNSPPEGVYK